MTLTHIRAMVAMRKILSTEFFDRDAIELAKALLGKVLRVRYRQSWLSAKIIETEAYYIHEKGSHSSLGFTEKRKALFMQPGTIYMYYARGGDSLNVSAQGEGNAVLIKSGIPHVDDVSPRRRSTLSLCGFSTCKFLHKKTKKGGLIKNIKVLPVYQFLYQLPTSAHLG